MAAIDADVPLREVQVAARHADPRTTNVYDRRRQDFDRHAAYVVVSFVAGGWPRANLIPRLSAATNRLSLPTIPVRGRPNISDSLRPRWPAWSIVARSAVDGPTVAQGDCHDKQYVVLDGVEDPIVADAHPVSGATPAPIRSMAKRARPRIPIDLWDRPATYRRVNCNRRQPPALGTALAFWCRRASRVAG
jgi:hypothetical protein